jgi:hypothetical protein
MQQFGSPILILNFDNGGFLPKLYPTKIRHLGNFATLFIGLG